LPRLGGRLQVKGGAVVDDPVGSGGEEFRLGRGGAQSENVCASGFAGARSGWRVFQDDANVRVKIQGGSTLKVGLGIGFAAGDVAGGDEMLDVFPEAGSAQADLGEGACRGSDDSELRGRNDREQFTGARKGDYVFDVFNFGALHPIVFREMNSGISVGEQFLNGGQAGAAMRGNDGVVGIDVVLEGPTRPYAGDGGSRVDEDAVHIEEHTLTDDLGHAEHFSGNWVQQKTRSSSGWSGSAAQTASQGHTQDQDRRDRRGDEDGFDFPRHG